MAGTACLCFLVLFAAAFATVRVAGQGSEGSTSTVTDRHVRVYVAELPPKYNLDLIRRQGCQDAHLVEQLLANPLGELADASLDAVPYRKSPYYGLDVHLHMTMLGSPLRVLSAEEADIVFVPLYATFLGEGGFALSDVPGACRPANWTEEERLGVLDDFYAEHEQHMPLLGTKPHWMPVAACEFVVVKGCGTRFGLPLVCHPLAKHITFTTPEAMTEESPHNGHMRFTSARPLHSNVVPIPYMGHIHDINTAMRANMLANKAVASEKDLEAVMAIDKFRGVELRKLLTEECSQQPSQCLNIHYSTTPRGFLDVLEGYRRAWFCIQPMGDTPTRAALLDCLASGLAIPLVFDEFLASMLPFSDVLDYRSFTAHMPYEAAMQPNASVLAFARGYDGEERVRMLHSLQRVSHVFQYAVAPHHLLVHHGSLAEVHPLDDAFTMSVKAVMRHACRAGSHHRHGGHCRKSLARGSPGLSSHS